MADYMYWGLYNVSEWLEFTAKWTIRQSIACTSYFLLGDDDVRFVLDQHVQLDCYSVSSLKQTMGRHIATLGHVHYSVILIPNQSVFALVPYCCNLEEKEH